MLTNLAYGYNKELFIRGNKIRFNFNKAKNYILSTSSFSDIKEEKSNFNIFLFNGDCSVSQLLKEGFITSRIETEVLLKEAELLKKIPDSVILDKTIDLKRGSLTFIYKRSFQDEEAFSLILKRDNPLIYGCNIHKNTISFKFLGNEFKVELLKKELNLERLFLITNNKSGVSVLNKLLVMASIGVIKLYNSEEIETA